MKAMALHHMRKNDLTLNFQGNEDYEDDNNDALRVNSLQKADLYENGT
jgi:hypothetical protein